MLLEKMKNPVTTRKSIIVKIALSLLVLVVGLQLSSSIPTTVEAAAVTQTINVLTSWVTILSGGLTSCSDPSDIAASDCTAGLASADAYMRNYSSSTGEPMFFSYSIDRNSPFVQMHPLDWGVNRYALQTIFNYSNYRSTHATLTSTRNMSYLQSPSIPMVISNALIPPSSTWMDVFKTIYYDEATKIAFISIQSGSQPNSFNAFEAVTGALAILARVSSHMSSGSDPWFPVVYYDDDTVSLASFVSFVTDPTKVEIRPAAILTAYEGNGDNYQVNGTWIVGMTTSSNHINHHRFGISATSAAKLQFETSEQTLFDLTNLPLAAKDAYYVQKQYELKNESNLASANDPVVGQSQFMPITRLGTVRLCMGGECPLGDLWTDAMRWKADADVAFESSGGIRGLGWPAGGVKVSDLWGSLPFINQICTGTISGINLFKVLNHSVALATFASTITSTGDRLMQVSGLRYTYNTLLPTSNRLVSVEIYNKVTGLYEPMERLKLYKFATNSFICTAFSPYPDFFTAADVAGEVAGTLGDDTMQEIVADYLGSLSSPYDTSIKGRLTNDTSAVAMASFIQTQASCPANTFWRPSIQTCQACAAGFVNPNPQDGGLCVAASKETDIVPIVVGIAVPVALLILAAFLYFLYRKDKMMRENIRDTENAPKIPGQLMAIILTDIQSSTDLWSIAPLSMSYALETHNKVISEIIALNKGFFVKASGDSFMIAVDCAAKSDGPKIVAKIVTDIQREMMKATFPRAINAIYNARTDDDLLDVDDDPNDLEDPSEAILANSATVDKNNNKDQQNNNNNNNNNNVPLFHGLRVRVGVAIGTACDIKFDNLAKTYDYHGPLVNVASRTEAQAHGGQVLLTPEAADLIEPKHVKSIITSCGKYHMRGQTDQVELYQILPQELSGRRTLFASSLPPDARRLGEFDSDNSSSIGALSDRDDESSLDSTFATEDIIFMIALFRAVRPKEKENIIRVFENCWRVRRHKTTEDTLTAIARKVSKVKIMMAEQEERKALREMQHQMTGGSTNNGGARKNNNFQGLLNNNNNQNMMNYHNNALATHNQNRRKNNRVRNDDYDSSDDSDSYNSNSLEMSNGTAKPTPPPSPMAKKLGQQQQSPNNMIRQQNLRQHQLQQQQNAFSPTNGGAHEDPNRVPSYNDSANLDQNNNNENAGGAASAGVEGRTVSNSGAGSRAEKYQTNGGGNGGDVVQ